MLKLLAKNMALNYPSYLHRMFTINCPSSITGLWTLIKLFLDKDTVKKVGIFGLNNWQQPLLQAVNPD